MVTFRVLLTVRNKDILTNCVQLHLVEWWTGSSKKTPYFVVTPKLVFQKFLLYFSADVDSRSRELFWRHYG